MVDEKNDLIKNYEQIAQSPEKELALKCLLTGIQAADPGIGIKNIVSLDGSILSVAGDEYNLQQYDRVIALGGGNAVGYAATALEDILGAQIEKGLVVTDNPVQSDRIQILRGDHPVPSEEGLKSTKELLLLADKVTENDLVVGLFTGGGSALLTAPNDIPLSAVQTTTDALLASGATIYEINAVRKHLSTIKGGQLARLLAPATTIGLLCSDVVSDDESVIASGPLTPDESSFEDALDILDTYNIDVPPVIQNLLQAGANGRRGETPDGSAKIFDSVHIYVVASNATATAAAADVARGADYTPLVLGSRLRGHAKEIAKVLVGIAEEAQATSTPVETPAVIISGGETTVDVISGGKGGPNQELAVSAALELNKSGITLAAVDTDGIDGNSTAAGGIVTSETVGNRLAARQAIDQNNTAQFLNELSCAIKTGPTKTNVNDLHAIVVSDN